MEKERFELLITKRLVETNKRSHKCSKESLWILFAVFI